jgi:cobalt-zinc-cadmium efflux system protein
VSKVNEPTATAHGNQVRINRAFYIGIGLNLVFTVVEFAAGIIYDSLALLSDAVHNLSDVGSLIIALIAYRLSKVAPTKRFTFGFGKTTILASLVNAIILLIVTGGIIREAIIRFSDPRPAEGVVIIVVAGIGIIINTLTAALFFRDKASDLNMKGAFLHMAIDAVVSLGVVISGIVILYSGWILIDPIISMVIAIVIIVSTWGLFRESLRLTADAVPEGINHEEVRRAITSVKGVTDVHHIHIWAISTTVNSLTAHIIISPDTHPDENRRIRDEVRAALLSFGITHATIELEPEEQECKNSNC